MLMRINLYYLTSQIFNHKYANDRRYDRSVYYNKYIYDCIVTSTDHFYYPTRMSYFEK